MLATAYGAIICNRHLAGVAGLLTAPYAEDRVGEIVGLYTITRFKGEGIGDRLIEVDLAFFDQREERAAAAPIKHRKVIFSLRTDHLGHVEITANVSGPHVRLQVVTDDSDATGEVSAHADDLRAALAAGDWKVDEVVYQTRQADSQNGVVRAVVEHVVSQDSLNRLV